MKRFIIDMKKHYRYALYSAKSELKAEVADSYLNWIWWILEPISFMLIYTFIFGYVFSSKEPYFPVFVYIGLTIWEFFNKNIKASVKMIKRNKGIIAKVYLPKFILVESTMMVNGFKMLISFIIIVILMIGYQVPLSANLLFAVPLLAILALVTFGLMCLIMHFGVYVMDLANIINIALRLVFYMTGIFYSIETRIGAKSPEIAAILGKCNPIAFLVNSFRKCIIYNETPSIQLMIIWFVIGILISTLGIRTIYKNENSYVKVI